MKGVGTMQMRVEQNANDALAAVKMSKECPNLLRIRFFQRAQECCF